MRKKRKLLPGATYHVLIRANRNYCILAAPQNKELFLKIVQRARKKYTFIVHSFCILDNKVDLRIEPTGNANLSRIMQWIESVYAIAYNKQIKCCGHVWYDRFKSWIISNCRQICRLFQTIPIIHAIASSPEKYSYTSENLNLMKRYGFCGPPE